MDIMLKYEDLKLKRYEERYEDLKFWQQQSVTKREQAFD